MSELAKSVFIPVDFCLKENRYYLKGYVFASKPSLLRQLAYFSALDFDMDDKTVFEGSAIIPASKVIGYSEFYTCPSPLDDYLCFPRLSIPGVRALGAGIYQIFAPKLSDIYDTSHGVWLLSDKSAEFLSDKEFQAIKHSLKFGNYDPHTGKCTSDSIFIHPFEELRVDINNGFDLAGLSCVGRKKLIIADIKKSVVDTLIIPDNVHIVTTDNDIKRLSCPKSMIACSAHILDTIIAPDTCNYFDISAYYAINLSIPRVVSGYSPCCWGYFALDVPSNTLNLDMSQYSRLKRCDISAKTISEDSFLCLGQTTYFRFYYLPKKMKFHARGISDDVNILFAPDKSSAPSNIDLYFEDIHVKALSISFMIYSSSLIPYHFNVHLASSVQVKTFMFHNTVNRSLTLKTDNVLPKLVISTRANAFVSAKNIGVLTLKDSEDVEYSIANVTRCRVSVPKQDTLQKKKSVVYVETSDNIGVLSHREKHFILKEWR